MAEDKVNINELHELDRILDSLDQFESEEEKELARKGQRLKDKYRHLQPDYKEENLEYF